MCVIITVADNGSLGLLVMTKQLGHIQEVRPEFDKLIKAGLRIEPTMLDQIYDKIGE